jgi:hypothetical protein
MKYFGIFLLICLFSCSKGTDYSKIIEGDWKLTSKKEDGNHVFSLPSYSYIYQFVSTDFDEGELKVKKNNSSSNSNYIFVHQFTFLDNGASYIQTENSLSVVHEVISFSDDYFEVSYSISGIHYEEIFERIQ